MESRIEHIRESEKQSHTEIYSNEVLYNSDSWLKKPIKTVQEIVPFFSQYDSLRVLDLGCGYGVIGIVVKAMHPTIQVTGIDINPRAVELAKENAKRNHVEMKTYVGDGLTNIKQTFDTILTNPPIRAGKSVIYSLFRDSYVHLNEGGKLVVVIRKQQGANSAKQELETIYGNCEIRTKEKGYWILIAKK